MLEILDILEKLVPVFSPSGEEEAARSAIRALAAPFCADAREDALGNLILRRPGSGPRVLIAAHMDTVGMIATHYDDNGFIRFGQLGGLSEEDLNHIPVRFANGVRGVVGWDGKAEKKDRKLAHYYIDIGAENREQAMELVPPGSRAAFCGGLERLGRDRVAAPYLDNRAGCAVALAALSRLEKTDYDLYFAFTAQEEVGLRGAKCAAYAVEPDYALALDVTDAGDVPEPELPCEMKLGGGAAVKIMDRSIVCHPELTRALQDAAARHGIPYQQDIMPDGGTDAGAIHLSRGGVPTGGISVPVRYIHSPQEVCDLRDAEAAARLLVCALEEQIFF